MKKLLIVIVICFFQNVFSQTIPKGKSTQKTEAPAEYVPSNTQAVNEDDDQVYNTSGVDVIPQFPGGMNEFYKFISKNYIVPKEKPFFVKGKVHATFVIEKDGSLNEAKISKDIGFGTGNEAIRVLQLCPKWSPAKLKGKEVRVFYAIPIVIN
ncbi:energy transducer TonB [Flavobacterium sp. LC2016-01]|uniref:energy transducer TonB n=1 Tax=Flavobacterium sp. LC2016-01 TaxID=2675876 RepID=UPI0012BAB692|nr:energy transducer TonB [Flavobacterium sp. LC2016-01]MTH18154.1 hypothetical protein [Flavobacterium sp. LC2016-01]